MRWSQGRLNSPREDDPPIHFLPLTGSNPRTYRFVGAETVLAEFRPDAILVEADPVSRLAVSLGRWARRHGAKCMCLSVDNLDFGFASHLRRTGIATLPQVVAKNALHLAAQGLIDVVFTISADGTAIFRRRGYNKVVQVPLGFDPGLFHVDQVARERVRRELGLPDGAVTFSYFGRVVPQKGVHLIVDALAQLRRAHPQTDSWRLMLDRFESGPYAHRIESLIEERCLAPYVIRIEARHEEVADYMRAADVALLASLTTRTSLEQYGRVIPEAMACGVLAVVSDSGTPKELVGDCGIVLPEGNVERLASTMEDIVLNPAAYAAMRAAGAERARTLYSLDEQADLYLEALNSEVHRCAS